LVLFLVAVLLVLYLGALLAHVLADARFYVKPDVDLYQRATSILAVLLWVTGIVVGLVAYQRGHPLVAEPWQRWPWISRAVAMLVVAALFKHIAILVSWASLPAGMHLETVTLALRAAGWTVAALGLLRGEEPLADVLHAERIGKGKG
jgi:hypothetical protein